MERQAAAKDNALEDVDTTTPSEPAKDASKNTSAETDKKFSPALKRKASDPNVMFEPSLSKNLERRATEPAPEPGEKRRTGRPRKVRRRPKKAISAYTCFVMASRKKLMEQNPDLSFKEVAKKIGDMWKNLSELRRAPFIAAALQDKERYEREKKTWKPPALEVKRRKAKDAPKNPLSAYTLFVVETRSEVSQENPKLNFGEIAVMVGEKWRHLEDERKMKYLVQAEQEKARYERQMEKYNAKCKQDADLARQEARKRRKKKRQGPKNPKSAYTFFVMEMRKSVAEANPHKTFGQHARIVADMWKNIGDDARAKYDEWALEDRARWKREKQEYEAKLSNSP